MFRHFHLFAAAPGREAEAEQALTRWLNAIASTPEFKGGAVLREYAGEFGDIQGALAVLYDVESREAGASLRRAVADLPNPMTPDTSAAEPDDQGAVLFANGTRQAPGQEHEPIPSPTELHFDRGGGLLARLMHGHFSVVAAGSPSRDAPG